MRNKIYELRRLLAALKTRHKALSREFAEYRKHTERERKSERAQAIKLERIRELEHNRKLQLIERKSALLDKQIAEVDEVRREIIKKHSRVCAILESARAQELEFKKRVAFLADDVKLSEEYARSVM